MTSHRIQQLELVPASRPAMPKGELVVYLGVRAWNWRNWCTARRWQA